jgi:imidazolonepropionase-like amidohydrolase
MRCIQTQGVYHPDDASIDGTVLVFDGGIVTAVRDDVPNDAELIADYQGYALPGLVDAHSHASIRPWEGNQIDQLCTDSAIQAVRSTANLRTDLKAGTTTMRLMGEERYLDIQLADLARSGELTAPRLLPSGVPLTPTGGHGHALTATDGPEEIRRRVRKNVDAGAHHIKYFATGGVSSDSGAVDTPTYSDEEVKAIIAEANRQGVHVAAHAHGGAGAEQAIDLGVDTIEHGGALEAPLLEMLDGSNRHVVGTFSILHHPQGIEGGDGDKPGTMQKVTKAREQEEETWTELLSRDIDVALGTDSMHGHLADEVEHLVSLGATPERALRAVTTEAARAARVDNRVGSLEPGKSADVVIVADHPKKTPETLKDPIAVLKQGDVLS